jgi:hypothetical protein
MKISCSSNFYNNFLKLLPKFLKLSPLARQYYQIELQNLIPKTYKFQRIGNYEFKFDNPFATSEEIWIKNFINKTGLFIDDKSQPIKELSIDYLSKKKLNSHKLYFEINPFVSPDKILISLKKTLQNYQEDYQKNKLFNILEANHKLLVLELCLNVTSMYDDGMAPKKIADFFDIKTKVKTSGNIDIVSGIYVSMLVRKCLTIADNAFLGTFVSEKKLTRSHH